MKYLHITVFLALCSCSSPNETKEAPDFCSGIHRSETVSLSQELTVVEPFLKEKTGVYVMEDGGNSLIARAWLSEYAEHTIDIQYFIFSMDNVGLIACDYLVRAADRGVKVRLLVDDMLIDAKLDDILKLDSHPNIEIKIYNPGVNLGIGTIGKIKKFAVDFHSANQRMHNKTFIVDGKVVITGGRNIADEYFDYDHEYNFRDRDVLFLGKAVKDVRQSFDQFWNYKLSKPASEFGLLSDSISGNPKKYEPLHQYACDSLNFWPQVRAKIQKLNVISILKSEELVWLDKVIFVSDLPGKNDGYSGLSGGGIATDSLIDLINRAKESIDIQTPYLISTKLSQEILRKAVKRGVEVRILTNSMASTDNLEAFSGYQRDREVLLRTGIRIFEFKPDAKIRYKVMTGDLQAKMHFSPIFGMHAKTMVIDGRITVIGTFNFDPRSANLNTECGAIIYSDKIASGVLKCMEEEFHPENAWETTLKFNPDSVAGKMKGFKTWTRRIVPKSIL